MSNNYTDNELNFCVSLSPNSISTESSRKGHLKKYNENQTSLDQSLLDNSTDFNNCPPSKFDGSNNTIAMIELPSESLNEDRIQTTDVSLKQYIFPNQLKRQENNGIFDDMLKNYSNMASVMDEPELSFVSYKTLSSQNTPTKATIERMSESAENTSALSTALSKTYCGYLNNQMLSRLKEKLLNQSSIYSTSKSSYDSFMTTSNSTSSATNKTKEKSSEVCSMRQLSSYASEKSLATTTILDNITVNSN